MSFSFSSSPLLPQGTTFYFLHDILMLWLMNLNILHMIITTAPGLCPHHIFYLTMKYITLILQDISYILSVDNMIEWFVILVYILHNNTTMCNGTQSYQIIFL